MPTEFTDTIEEYRRTFQARLRRQQEMREAERQQALQAVREKAPAVISSQASVRRAYLFGSVTRPGAFHPQSDIDIAVEGATPQEYFSLWRALEHALPDWTIDVRDITSASSFGALVRRTGVLIYERADSPASS